MPGELELIDESALTFQVDAYSGCRAFEQHLYSVASERELMTVLGRYVEFNALFGAGVANLVGCIAARRDLFRSPVDSKAITADRSMEVAADFFAAIVDELGGKGGADQYTHRFVVQQSFLATAAFFHRSPDEVAEVTSVNAATRAAVSQVKLGYGFAHPLTEAALRDTPEETPAGQRICVGDAPTGRTAGRREPSGRRV